MGKATKDNKRTALIVALCSVGVVLLAAIIVLIIVLISKNTFVKTDGVKVTRDSEVASDCRIQASIDAVNFWTRTQTLVDPMPTKEGWDLNEKVVMNDTYNSAGYPTYTYTWDGDYDGSPVRYECLIETNKDSAKIIWLKQLSTKIVDNTIDLYNSKGERI